MLTAILLTALGASEPQAAIIPRAPGTNQTSSVRALLPQDEDWSGLDEESPSLKNVDHPQAPSMRFSFGLDARFHAEYFDNEAFGALPGEDESIFLMLTPWASATFNDRIRFYGALKHASVQGRKGPRPGAINESLDLHQGFVEVALGDAVGQSRNDLLFRVGRQELHYGAGRFLSLRGGRFIRDDYDGALIRYRRGSWVTDFFGVFSVEDETGSFDNGTNDDLSLSGIYSSGVANNINIDLYALRLERDDVVIPVGQSKIVREYAGARVSGTGSQDWRWEIEATIQSGSVKATDDSIRGFQIGGRLAKPISNLNGTPTPTLEFLYSTGDDDPSDDRVETFLAPAASGLVYEDVTQPLGPGNLAWVKGSMPFNASERLRVTPYLHAYWRVENRDALHTLFNTVLVPATSGDGDFVGLDIGFTARYAFTENLAAIAYGSHFDAGGVFNNSDREATGTSAMLGLTFRY